MQRTKTVAVIAGFVLALGIVGRMDREDAERAERTPVAHVTQEDELYWDCATNGLCYDGGEPIVNWPAPDSLP